MRVRHVVIRGLSGQLKYEDTRAETKFRLSAKRTSPFKSAGGRQFIRLLAAEVCVSAVVMLDIPCSEVVWRVLAIHSIRQFPLHFHSRASPCVITFQLQSTYSTLLYVYLRYDSSNSLKYVDPFENISINPLVCVMTERGPVFLKLCLRNI